MIKEFVSRFTDRGHILQAIYTEKHPDNYMEVVKNVISVLTDDKDYYSPDPERVHEIDYGDYQGTLVYVIASKGYQPDTYWYVKVGYGSCSGCDTLQYISRCSSAPPTSEQVKDYMTLSLHIVQGIGKMNDTDPENN